MPLDAFFMEGGEEAFLEACSLVPFSLSVLAFWWGLPDRVSSPKFE